MRKTIITACIIILAIFLVIVIEATPKHYSQEELTKLYDNCEGVPNHYFFDKDANSYGVRCFNIETAKSFIWGDCEKILEYEKSKGLFFKRLYKCKNKVEFAIRGKDES